MAGQLARQCRILIVDDLKKWRDEPLEILQKHGYYVEVASTVVEALDRLSTTLFHILLLDIRLVHNDPGNIEGINVLPELEKRGLSQAIKVIMLSAYGTKEQLRTLFAEYEIADFLFKEKFGEQILLDTIQRVFTEDVCINLDLDVRWQRRSKPEQAILSLEIEGMPLKRNRKLQEQMALELDDLLCRLFSNARGIVVQPLPDGRSGTGILRVQPSYETVGVGNEVILKFGEYRKIEEEHNNFKKYVQAFVGGGRRTTVQDVRRTPHLGGIIYTLLGTSNDSLVDFGTFYNLASLSQIKHALDRLFNETCKPWYSNRNALRLINLIEEYERTSLFSKRKIESVLSRQVYYLQGRQKFCLRSLGNDRIFTNPLLAIDGLSLTLPAYLCPTHGDFNQYNLLVDGTGDIWLIDFQETGVSHILRDVAMLDAVLRFQVLSQEEATLDERLQMETALCSVERFSQVPQLAHRFTPATPALSKAFATVLHLRMLAHQLIDHNHDDISEYYVALLYSALSTLCFSSLQPVQREHALLSASLLADRLGVNK